MINKYLGFLLVIAFLSNNIMAQTGQVRGNIYDNDTGEPIIYGNVQLLGTSLGTNTNIDGFFTLTNVPVGDYKLVATYLGYDSVAVDVKISANKIVYKSLLMTESGIQLSTVNISARKEENRTEVKVSKLTVTPQQIRSLPSTGGDADIAQYLSIIPGVIFTGDQGGQLYIRGGSPIQNKILLDGMTIYNPFHSLGFFSVFETETIRSVDVLTGAFNAEYGGRISAIVDIKTREGNKKRLGGIVSASPFQAKALFEGPIKKLEENGGSASFLLTAKHSYIDETSKTIYDYAVENDSLGLPYNYTDLYGKVSFNAANGSKLNLFGFNFQDKVNFDGLATLDWRNTGAGVDFTLVPSANSIIVKGHLSASDYEITLDEGDGSPRISGITAFDVGLDFTYFGKDSEVNYGFVIGGFKTDFKFRNFVGITINQVENTTELSGFFKYRKKFGNLIVEPGLRMQFYASLSDLSIEPRIGLKYNATPGLRFKAAAGMYSQNLISTVNERDIVNLFVGFLSGPDESFFKPNSTEKTDHRLQKSIHGVAGVEIDLLSNLELNIEPYYKRFTQLIALNRNKLTATEPDYVTETGDAYGIDFSVRYETSKLYLWGTYSLGYVNRDDGEQEYPTIFDRRHNVNLLATYSFGPKKEWEFGARWNMGSGFPFTLTEGFYTLYNFTEGLSADYISENGELGIEFSEDRNSGRLPYYHRLDLSLKRTFTFTKYTILEVNLSVTNAYDRENIFFFDRVEYSRVNQLPILPSLGTKLSF